MPLFLILFFFNFNYLSSQYIEFPLNIEKQIINKENSPQKVIESLETINYYTLIKIGNPQQTLKFYFTFNKQEIFICSEKMKDSVYKESKSNTYKLNYNIPKEFFNGVFNEGFLSLDEFYLSNITNNNKEIIQKFNFILATSSIYVNYLPSQIGLSLPDYYSSTEYTFINQLKEKKLINSIVWNIKILNNNKGTLVFGLLPHEYNKKNYNLNDFRNTNAIKVNTNLIWGLEFSNITIGGKNILIKQNKCKIDINFGFIIQSYRIMEEYENIFFNKFIQQNICYKSKYNSKYFFYCNKELKIKTIPSISFINKELNYIFNIDYKDLFIEIYDKYYFLILFSDSELEEECILGEIFIRNYQLIFDEKNKAIGLYIRKNNWSFIKILLLLILVIIIFIIGLYLGLLLKKKRKIRANELEDEFIYESK